MAARRQQGDIQPEDLRVPSASSSSGRRSTTATTSSGRSHAPLTNGAAASTRSTPSSSSGTTTGAAATAVVALALSGGFKANAEGGGFVKGERVATGHSLPQGDGDFADRPVTFVAHGRAWPPAAVAREEPAGARILNVYNEDTVSA